MTDSKKIQTIIRSFTLITLITLSTTSISFSQPDINVGGFMQTWFLNSQTTYSGQDINNESVTGIRIRRARIRVTADINQTYSALAMFEFSTPDHNMLDFHVDGKYRDWFNVRVGQFILPGQTFDTGILPAAQMVLFERPSATSYLANNMGYSAFRDIGMMLYGTFNQKLEYGIHIANGFGRFTHTGNNIQHRDTGSGTVGGRVDYHLTDEITLGGHYAVNRQKNVIQNDSDPFDIDRSSYSFRFSTDGFLSNRIYSESEWMNLTIHDENDNYQLNSDDNYDMYGFYTKAGFRLHSNWDIVGRYDHMIQKPGQVGPENSVDRQTITSFTGGITHYLEVNDNQIGRVILNYINSDSQPVEQQTHQVVLVLQLMFL